MARYVMVQGSGVGIFLVPDFDDEPDAQAYATEHAIGGTIAEEAVYLAGPKATADNLTAARSQKQLELMLEGDRRSALVDASFRSVLDGLALGLSTTHPTLLGLDWVAVGQAWDLAAIDVSALPSTFAVDAYDVVNDPAWP